MYTLKVYNRAGECIKWFTGTAKEVAQVRDLWQLIYVACTLDVEPPLTSTVLK
jgi:hypothetical protein